MAARIDAPVEKYFDLRVFTRENLDSVDKHNHAFAGWLLRS